MSGLFMAPPIMVPFMELPTAMLAFSLLGFEIVRGVQVLVHHRRREVVDHILVNESGLQIGVRVNSEGKLELLVDEDELRQKEGIEMKDFECQVQQKYQYAELMTRLKAEGYTVVEETEEQDETIRLVVRRWR